MNLALAFAETARRLNDKAAIIYGARRFSYSDLLATSRAAADRLRTEFHVKPGDRVGLWLKNCPEFIPALFGVLELGAVAVPINNFLKPPEVSYIIADAGIDTLLSDSTLAAQFPALVADKPSLRRLEVESLAECTAPEPFSPPEAALAESGLAVLIYTSGTTGRPKGAMLSHGNLLHNVESCRRVLDATEADRVAVLLPMFHSYMLTVGILLPLLVGGSIVLAKSLTPARNLLQEILENRTTILPAIPQFYRSMLSAPLPAPLPIRLCVSGAAPLPAQVLKEFEEKFHIPLIEGYGLSEASPVVTKNPLDGRRKAGSIGLPIPNVEVSIQDETGRMLPPMEVGEVCVRGGNVMHGYWKRPEETAKVMRDGWLLTGDVGYRDAEGYYYITDRKKDMLLVNGINVYPREIEEILYQFPGVKEAAVIGKPDARKGEQPIAFVAPNDGAALDDKAIQQFLRERLADYKLPKKIVQLASLPRNATGKILKTTLRELAVS
ncbi:MAG TPA: long-chain fatty acid--CoA ligase [Verrucomicrobiae bacterium]|nr:long-chain fatty acid--CoA ligase [Verrucomicrobiae bacterium]